MGENRKEFGLAGSHASFAQERQCKTTEAERAEVPYGLSGRLCHAIRQLANVLLHWLGLLQCGSSSSKDGNTPSSGSSDERVCTLRASIAAGSTTDNQKNVIKSQKEA